MSLVEEGFTREQVVGHLYRGLEADPSVYAMWIEGSLARGDVDDMSDVDLVADVEDGFQDRVFQRAEALLAELGPLGISLELDVGHQFLRPRFYRLERTPEFWTIDFVLQAHSRNFVFDREDEVAVRVLFDKAGVVRFGDHPWRPDGVESSLAELADTYGALRPWVVKQVRPGQVRGGLRVLRALRPLAPGGGAAIGLRASQERLLHKASTWIWRPRLLRSSNTSTRCPIWRRSGRSSRERISCSRPL